MFKDTWYKWRLHMRIIFILLIAACLFLLAETYKRGYRDGMRAALAAPK
jgi:hypothetical protein